MAMTLEQFQRSKELFDQALDRPASERAAFLARACGDDAELRRGVESLLAHTAGDDSFFDPSHLPTLGLTDPVGKASRSNLREFLPGAPTRIGRYNVVKEIGHGGMGTVYLAIQSGEGFEKRVALKIIRRGMDTELVVRLFLAERRILASLEHPNIARLYDGGATEDGLPWFAMEYIEGEHLQDYCDRRDLDVRARLALFQQICAGVQYAHQALIVHRDIKPGNILVTADGTPKLLDFGLAKLVHSEASAQTVELTATRNQVFTPQYASPEQVRGERMTTATDVFSLGLVLYQLLAGCHPYREDMSSTESLLAAICEKEARPPSACAAARLVRELKGDLDTIVLTALQKDPRRRYASVEQLRQDIRRYLEGLPVTARPDTLVYRAGKFVRRHRVSVAAAALVAISLVGGAGVAVFEAGRSRQSEALAQKRFNDVRKLANEYLFEFHDAIRDLPGATPARLLVIRRGLEYLDRISADAGDDPGLTAELAGAYERLGELQAGGQPGQLESNLNDNHAGVASFEKALALRERIAARTPDGLAERRALAKACAKLGIARAHALFPQATLRPLIERSHALLRDVVSQAPLDRDARRDLALSYRNLTAAIFDPFDEPGKALEATREEARLFSRLAEEDPRNEADRRQSGIALRNLGSRLPAADGAAPLKKSVEIAEDLLRKQPMNVERRLDLADALHSLGANTAAQRKDDQAEKHLRRALAIRTEIAGKDAVNARPLTGLGRSYLEVARLELDRGRLERAAEEAASGLDVIGRFRAGHPDDLRRFGIESDLRAALAATREAQAKGASPSASRVLLKEARDLYTKSRELNEEIVATVPVAAKRAAAFGLDAERCEAALAALPEH
jgi:tRNA A-37 threonylcarbamoyl transferase component Bud32